MNAAPSSLGARRITRKRGKAKPLPPGAIYVGKPTIWANPFQGRGWGHAKSVVLYRRWLSFELGTLSLERLGFSLVEIEALDRLRARVLARLGDLSGKDVACWCPPTSRWCHADTLLALASRQRTNLSEGMHS